MDITYRIPSKKVPYGYIEFTWKRESGTGMPDPLEMAEEYAQYIKDYQSAEVQAFENPRVQQIKKADDVDEARKILEEGLDTTTTEVDGDDPAAPWNQTSDTNESSEEMETSSSSDDDDWDF